MYRHNKNNAFTLLELIFVILILGVVASIGSRVIAKVYEQYIIQRAQYKASFKTELAALQIANRLRYAIPRTLYRIKDDNSMEAFSNTPSASGSYIGLEWIGADGDSFEAGKTPGWSGFCDLNASSRNTVVTPGSDLALTQNTINNLGGNLNRSVLIFANETNQTAVNVIRSFDAAGNKIILVDNTPSRRLSEHYKLAWSSYALAVENGDLYLYYNFSPILAANRANGSRSLLLKHVTVFKFTGTENTIRFKICKSERIGDDANITACKEKAVF